MRRRSRRAALAVPFPPAWRAMLERDLSWWTSLTGDERSRMEDLIRLFLADKSFEGTVGFEPTEQMKVEIAAQACLLILELGLELYDDVTAIIIAPSVMKHRGPRGLDGGVVTEDNARLAGQAVLHGPVLVVWDQVANQARHPQSGQNVVFHEFAHKIDMRNGAADGIPPLTHELSARWANTMDDLISRMRSGSTVALDSYAATNPAELLAVSTEVFFAAPDELLSGEPDIYELLKNFYRQDPATRHRTAPPAGQESTT